MDSYYAEQIADNLFSIKCRLDEISESLKTLTEKHKPYNPLGSLVRRDRLRRHYLADGNDGAAAELEEISRIEVECLRHVHQMIPELFGGFGSAMADNTTGPVRIPKKRRTTS
ncbi:MAG: hypothetical protein KC800_05625 [Candidatus Eremiobacteraeota bacterium]|nr:hypothetical protein [Candidatus Eremiobacteraeota bacterium]